MKNIMKGENTFSQHCVCLKMENFDLKPDRGKIKQEEYRYRNTSVMCMCVFK